jgi:glycine dehydrogenase subunit 1
MTLLGEKGLRQLAEPSITPGRATCRSACAVPGVTAADRALFQRVHAGIAAKPAPNRCRKHGRKGRARRRVSAAGLWPGEPGLDKGMMVAVTETVSASDFDALVRALTEVVSQ